MTSQETIHSLEDRPPIVRVISQPASTLGEAVRQNVAVLAHNVGAALKHADELSISYSSVLHGDTFRDVLHLRARIEGISRQIKDAAVLADWTNDIATKGNPESAQFERHSP
jgi:hypothetical protein